jgi:hypothetical protein
MTCPTSYDLFRELLTFPGERATVIVYNQRVDATYPEWLRDGPDDATATGPNLFGKPVRSPSSVGAAGRADRG